MPTVYLIPSSLTSDYTAASPDVIHAIGKCNVFFAESLRTARRFIKMVCPEFVIDNVEWVEISKHDDQFSVASRFRQAISSEMDVGILSEAGCPGIADPGQQLVSVAHEMGATVKPLVGPNSILLALMASGMNGQRFQFVGYLPIEKRQRIQAIRQLEVESAQKQCTQVFIETPYRNNPLLHALLSHCSANTLLCIASNLTSASERTRTLTIANWKKQVPDLNKVPTVYCLMAEQT